MYAQAIEMCTHPSEGLLADGALVTEHHGTRLHPEGTQLDITELQAWREGGGEGGGEGGERGGRGGGGREYYSIMHANIATNCMTHNQKSNSHACIYYTSTPGWLNEMRKGRKMNEERHG